MSHDRTRTCPSKLKTFDIAKILAIWALSHAFLLGCAESHSPNTEELITVRPPTISNVLTNGLLTTPNKNFTLTGTCDPTGFGMQYQRDGGDWTDFSPGCVNGTWSLPSSVIRRVNIGIRSKSKFRFTAAATVTARFVLPPTSPVSTLVASGITEEDNAYGRQMAVPHGFDGKPMISGSYMIFPHIVGATYGK